MRLQQKSGPIFIRPRFSRQSIAGPYRQFAGEVTQRSVSIALSKKLFQRVPALPPSCDRNQIETL
jgi:hypothetical protein